MDRLGARRQPILLIAAAVAACTCWHALSHDPPAGRALAVPHVLSNKPHPLDPDWLQVQVILRQKCNACHRQGTDRYDLTTYEAIMAAGHADEMPAIVPGNPEESYLWESVAWNARAEPDCELPDTPDMPDDKHEWLTAGQLEIFYRWIKNGALEYKLPDTCDVRPLLEIDFPSARECKTCHPKQYREWSRSMHHYAQLSPIFEAFNLTLLERTGGTLGTFCSRCHTPLGTAIGENGLRRNVNRSRLSLEGVTCVVCHRQSKRVYKSNARQFIQPGTLIDECMYGPFENPVTEATNAHPAGKNPFIKTSAFCGSCHDVLAPNGIRLEEAFSEWQNSPAARAGITCQQCHMGPIQGVPIAECERPLGRAAEVPGVDPKRIPLRPLSDHTFAGPDYSLLPDTEFPHKLDWMYETDYRNTQCLTPYQAKTLRELRVANRRELEIARSKRYELLRNGAELSLSSPPCAAPGEKIKLEARVTSKFGGHSYPTGFTAERQFWVQITVWDPHGRPVFRSGDLDPNGDLRDSHSHAVESGKLPYDKHLLNFQNKFIALTRLGTERSVVLSVNRHLQPLNFIRPPQRAPVSFGRPFTFRIAKGSLAPLRTMSQKYPVKLPHVPGRYLVQARLNFRHLPPVLLDEIGAPHLKHLLEIVVIDECQKIIQVSDSPAVVLPLARKP